MIQNVYVAVDGQKSFRLLPSDYPPSDVEIRFRKVESLKLIDDIWLHKINNIVIQKYADILGSQPSILKIEQSPPYYRLTYGNGQK